MSINADRLEEMAGQVLQIYGEAEKTMMERVARRAARGVDEPGWTETKYAEMTSVRKEMSSFVGRLSEDRKTIQEKFLQEAYEEGQTRAISDARRFADLAGVEHLTANAIKVVNIISELDEGMYAADRQILRNVNDAFANIVGKASALVATGTITTREAVQRELREFAQNGIKSFRDRAGRVWDMETYAEMATLTAIERATRAGYMDVVREFGYDLVIISDHYGACPICEAWQGVVVSIDGKTPGYLTLDDAEAAGVFHPRCMHDYSVYFEGINSQHAKLRPDDVGKPSAGYTVRSQQRYFERQERKWKRTMAVAQTPEEQRIAYNHVKMYQEKIRNLRETYNASTPRNVDYLPRKYWREGGKAPKLSTEARKLNPAAVLQTQSKSVTSAAISYYSPLNPVDFVNGNMTERDVTLINKRFQMLDRIYHAKVESVTTTLARQQQEYDIYFKNGVEQKLRENPRMRRSTAEKRMLEVLGPRPTKAPLSVGGDYDMAWRILSINNDTFVQNGDIKRDIWLRKREVARASMRIAKGRTAEITTATVGETYEAVFIHEYGHAIDATYRVSKNEKFLEFYRSLRRDEIEQGLSEYAATNEQEFIAEAFAASFMGEFQGDISRRFMVVLREIVGI